MKIEDVPERAIPDQKTQTWRCKTCGSTILVKEQIVSMHLKGTMGGFGETYRRKVPFCPECETEPPDTDVDYYGSPTDPDVIELELIKSMSI